MKKHSPQQGSAHAVIIVCLVLALITTLSWVFYQNFIYKAPVDKDIEVIKVGKDTTQPRVEDEKEKPKQEEDTDKGYLVIKEWGVKFKIPASLADTTVGYEEFKWNEGTSSEHIGYGLFTARTKQKAIDCIESARLVGLSRGTVGPDPNAADVSWASKTAIDGYYYTYTGQAAYFCSNDSRETLIEETKLLSSMVDTIEKE